MCEKISDGGEGGGRKWRDVLAWAGGDGVPGAPGGGDIERVWLVLLTGEVQRQVWGLQMLGSGGGQNALF